MGPILTPHAALTPSIVNGVNGSCGFASTRLGNQVKVWIPNPTNPINQQYFCHGHSLGTFTVHGYSVFSGQDFLTVLRDEHALVGNVHNATPGDIVVWHNPHPGAPGMGPNNPNALFPDHSAIVTHVAIGADGLVDPINTLLSSKNGFGPLIPTISLDNLIGIYGDTFAVYR